MDGGHDAQDLVDLTVAAREPVPDVVPGGGVDRGGAGPGREMVPVGNRDMSPTSTSSRAGGADAVQAQQRGTGLRGRNGGSCYARNS